MLYRIAILALAFSATVSAQTYLGKPNGSKYDLNSQNNPHGQYGSKYAPNSVNNPHGRYGSPYSPYSATNPYATQAPVVYRNGTEVGRQTTNPYADQYRPATRYDDVDVYSDDTTTDYYSDPYQQ